MAKDYNHFMQELMRPSRKLPAGCRHAYIACHISDKNFIPVFVSFKPEPIAERCADRPDSYRVMRIAVMRIEGHWHKVGILPLSQKVMMDAPLELKEEPARV